MCPHSSFIHTPTKDKAPVALLLTTSSLGFDATAIHEPIEDLEWMAGPPPNVALRTNVPPRWNHSPLFCATSSAALVKRVPSCHTKGRLPILWAGCCCPIIHRHSHPYLVQLHAALSLKNHTILCFHFVQTTAGSSGQKQGCRSNRAWKLQAGEAWMKLFLNIFTPFAVADATDAYPASLCVRWQTPSRSRALQVDWHVRKTVNQGDHVNKFGSNTILVNTVSQRGPKDTFGTARSGCVGKGYPVCHTADCVTMR